MSYQDEVNLLLQYWVEQLVRCHMESKDYEQFIEDMKKLEKKRNQATRD